MFRYRDEDQAESVKQEALLENLCINSLEGTCSGDELYGLDSDSLPMLLRRKASKLKEELLTRATAEIKAACLNSGAIYCCTNSSIKKFLITRCGFQPNPQSYWSENHNRRVYVMVRSATSGRKKAKVK